MTPDSDLSTPTLPLMAWTSERTAQNLADLYAWVERLATDAIAWYMNEKRPKARWSRRLRALALVLATLGGAVPVVALAAGRAGLGNWGYPLLALSAGALAYDRFFGYSSAWQRYLSTATALRAELTDFQLAWARELALADGQPPEGPAVGRLIDLVRAFARRVNERVHAETQIWLVEFNTGLAELDNRLAQRESA